MTLGVSSRVTQGTAEYEFLEQIGIGGFATAYKARKNDAAGTIVVVKVPHPQVLADEEWSLRFDREARILGNLYHPHIAQNITYWQFDNGDKALVQEYIPNALHLDEFLKSKPDHAASLYLQTLYAVRAFHSAHSPSVIHRDLSPTNILVTEDGCVKIIDFGLAKEHDRESRVLTKTGKDFGTVGCMAPEQMGSSKHVDHRADLFALGKAFTGALLGRDPLHAVPQKLGVPWNKLLVRMTEYDAAERPESAEEAIVDAMDAFTTARVPISNFELHIDEHFRRESWESWPELCELHFMSLPVISQADIELAARIHPRAMDGLFDNDALFDKLEASSAIGELCTSSAAWSDADPFGILYKNLCTRLTRDRKLRCFRRACKVAIKQHRYSVMGKVREMYEAEKDDSVRAEFSTILDIEDGNKTIEGRDIIPGR